MALSKRKNDSHEEESFFVSMTDIMIGLLFIFIIIVVYFAQQIDAKIKSTDDYVATTKRQKTLILNKIRNELKGQGVANVEVDQKQGILRLPEGVLFDSGKFIILPDTKPYDVTIKISKAFHKVLKCSVLQKKNSKLIPQKDNCFLWNKEGAFVDSIFIEGHTDPEPYRGGNFLLAARRSTQTYDLMMKTENRLKGFFSPEGKQIFAVSAFGETRPIKPNNSEENKQANRRIDIRVLMYVPQTSSALKQFKKRLCNEFDYSKYC